MNNEQLSKAVEAISKHTGKAYQVQHESGMFMVKCTEERSTHTILAAKTKKQLFDGICYYIQGYHAGRRSNEQV